MSQELSKAAIAEAAEWETRNKELRQMLRDHKEACGHWALGPTFEVLDHHQPQFPSKHFRKCEFCGEDIAWC